jgi:hypothetical protein
MGVSAGIVASPAIGAFVAKLASWAADTETCVQDRCEVRSSVAGVPQLGPGPGRLLGLVPVPASAAGAGAEAAGSFASVVVGSSDDGTGAEAAGSFASVVVGSSDAGTGAAVGAWADGACAGVGACFGTAGDCTAGTVAPSASAAAAGAEELRHRGCFQWRPHLGSVEFSV